jgi:PPOX class probable F420-dependent enzyme
MPSRRTEIEMTEEEVRAFLDEQMVMQCATIGPRGLPHMVPLWFVRDGSDLRGWTYAKSQKARNLERDPRATLGIETGVEYQELRGVMLECDVALERDPERVAGYGLELVDRYAGGVPEAKEAFRRQATKRVGLRFTPTRTVSWDHRKLGGGY